MQSAGAALAANVRRCCVWVVFFRKVLDRGSGFVIKSIHTQRDDENQVPVGDCPFRELPGGARQREAEVEIPF